MRNQQNINEYKLWYTFFSNYVGGYIDTMNVDFLLVYCKYFIFLFFHTLKTQKRVSGWIFRCCLLNLLDVIFKAFLCCLTFFSIYIQQSYLRTFEIDITQSNTLLKKFDL